MNKRDDLVTFIAGDEPDTIMITEVIPKAQIKPIEAQLLHLESYDIIMITEVIPKAQIKPIEAQLLHLESYDVYVNFDESATNLGDSGIRGVAIYVKEDLYVIGKYKSSM